MVPFSNCPICGTNQFMSHNTDAQWHWPWHNPAGNEKLNISARTRLQEMLGWWISISFSCHTHLLYVGDTGTLYHIHFAYLDLYVGISICFNSYSFIESHLAKRMWRGRRHPPPSDRWICHAKLVEIHPSNMSWNLLLTNIFNSPISAGMYHDHHIATSMLCCETQINLH